MFVESNKALVQRYFDAVLNAQRWGVIDELFGGYPLLADATRKTVSEYRLAVPDIRYTLDSLIAEEDRVVACWTARGTTILRHKGFPFPLGALVMSGIHIFRVTDGQFTGLHPMTRLPRPAPETWGDN